MNCQNTTILARLEMTTRLFMCTQMLAVQYGNIDILKKVIHIFLIHNQERHNGKILAQKVTTVGMNLTGINGVNGIITKTTMTLRSATASIKRRHRNHMVR